MSSDLSVNLGDFVYKEVFLIKKHITLLFSDCTLKHIFHGPLKEIIE